MVTQEVKLAVSPTTLLTRCAGEPFVFALDGAETASWGTGDALLGFRPRATLRVDADGTAVVVCDGGKRQWRGDPFTLLERFCRAYLPARDTAADHRAGGVVAALSYDLRHWVEHLPQRVPDDLELPVLHAAFYDWLLSYSYVHRRYTLASSHCSRARLRRIAAEMAARVSATQTSPARVSVASAAARPAAARACVLPDTSRDRYLSAVRAILDYIAAGDVYQVNLAQRFVLSQPPAPPVLFAALQSRHPVPFGAYVDGGDFVLISNSPECFLTMRDAMVATFPIKGTRPRGADPSADAALAKELRADPKERAEHVMIVDLERNDLGRVCQPGSVRVEDLAAVQTFPTLHHLVSKVTGRLRPGISLADVLRATFPGGSITGAPKIRAMQIIDELEPVGRGFYTGAVGFIGADGSAVFNLAIRTVVATPQKVAYHAGGGIVADSVPAREYAETLLKARPVFAALAGPP